MDVLPQVWWWLSFTDADSGAFLGVAVVDVQPIDVAVAEFSLPSMSGEQRAVAAAVTRSHELGCNPGGRVTLLPLDSFQVDEYVPEGFRRRLLSLAEAMQIGGGR